MDFYGSPLRSVPFLNKNPKAKQCLVVFNFAITWLIVLSYIALCALFALGIFERTGINAVKIFLLPCTGLFFVEILRRIFNRPRPYERTDIQPVIGKKKQGGSFPSRHLFSAFVIGTVWLFYALPVGIALLVLGLVLGYIRFAAGIHYPSDLFFGALFGVLFGLPVFFF